ncbi:hypothetical protein RND71_028592 [Anisodus tanguticus]|uniref:Uncharacterized protein n=1 Tax=Anisodus tanguticus TaxID=243964 RepID=A0AAE1RL11_9SOLA|nr:hypothetical protein RND71_028592 [Anisodus tanguticus]
MTHWSIVDKIEDLSLSSPAVGSIQIAGSNGFGNLGATVKLSPCDRVRSVEAGTNACIRKLGANTMGLVSIIRKIKRKEKEMCILMVGLDNSGKTTIVLKINGEDTSVISPTLGFSIKTIIYRRMYFVRHVYVRLSGASLLIFANKQDIQGALSPDEIAKVPNLEALDNRRHWRIVGCSAYTGEGLLEGFDWLVDVASRIYMLERGPFSAL